MRMRCSPGTHPSLLTVLRPQPLARTVVAAAEGGRIVGPGADAGVVTVVLAVAVAVGALLQGGEAASAGDERAQTALQLRTALRLVSLCIAPNTETLQQSLLAR